MNIIGYRAQAKVLDTNINSITSEMFNTYSTLFSKNADQLSALLIERDFNFVSRAKEMLQVENSLYIFACKIDDVPVYIDSQNQNIVTLSYDSEYGINLPTVLDNNTIKNLFKNPEVYEDIMHIVGLDGILESSIQLKKETLNNLQIDWKNNNE
ncbi:hypothetical protein [Pediococcus claussenii]|uniref:Uncharacterized protein n=1 Tax=Pediococcus claussenii (strain ATCC BAA-344 / DSM 14800 / JCM 18046 / KCTC 3811 / LMG 21948 / P06) TaxID=701521 RepID=G8PD11_PEDCP|nr:hypothetical protein [Pediococcus claussenii]AEV95146.1 hypothetical protein PECL_874 [Pediococcus claussenii ATCC BAA-344]ANZ70329.1 hypothetical protein AYR57_08370 [Pediococcus claussenii]ANZ72145.1 hypothetical protein AYR58_08370 [Pediococcus claussenii]KRN19671.1 hypothetical protein IV79_GL001389 [Pediococcus claussenii]